MGVHYGISIVLLASSCKAFCLCTTWLFEDDLAKINRERLWSLKSQSYK